ncbi:MAG: hypothetical protein M9962_05730 [Oligoflexia bacterium]|nr:hypothetical protein [Oligoflexia bacterium]
MKNNKSNALEKLRGERSKNVLNLIQWSLSDFMEMEETYNKAKEVAIDSQDNSSVAILDEKISQLNEARSLRESRPDASM